MVLYIEQIITEIEKCAESRNEKCIKTMKTPNAVNKYLKLICVSANNGAVLFRQKFVWNAHTHAHYDVNLAK